jgi:hypothetical protein
MYYRKVKTSQNAHINIFDLSSGKVVFFVVMIICLFSSIVLANLSSCKHEVTYNGDCFLIDGEGVCIYSGSIHYFRCPQALWGDRLLKIKRGHFDAVQTYIPWNYHVPVEGKADLSEFQEFLDLCGEIGLYVIARPGPYICAEWDGGGFPDWLIAKDVHLRTNDDDYIEYVRQWYEQVMPVIKKNLVTNGGQIILVQVENEYGHDSWEKQEAIRRMYGFMKNDHKVDVPIVACNTSFGWDNEDAIMAEIVNGWNSGGVRWDNIERIEKLVSETVEDEFNGPAIVLEHPGGGGVHSNYVNRNAKRIITGDYSVVNRTAFMEGAALTNFYMLFGGTNFGYTGAGFQSTSYWGRPTVVCPMSECAGLTDDYYLVKLTGQWLGEFGGKMVQAKEAKESASVTFCDTGKKPKIVEKIYKDQAFIFIRQRNDAEQTIRFEYFDPIAKKSENVPKNGSLKLQARDMQILATNVRVSGGLMKYSTSQILGVDKIEGQSVIILYGVEGSDGETAFKMAKEPDVSGCENASWDDAENILTVNYTYRAEVQSISVDDVVLLVTTHKKAMTSWVMTSNDAVLPVISDSYLARDYKSDGKLHELILETLPGKSSTAVFMSSQPEAITVNDRAAAFVWDQKGQTAVFNVNTPELPFKSISLKKARIKKDPSAGYEKAEAIKIQPLEDVPVFSNGYLVYTSYFEPGEAEAMAIRFYAGSVDQKTRSCQLVGDPVTVFVNGKCVTEVPVWHKRKVEFDLAKYAKEGQNKIEIVLEKLGRPSHDAGGFGLEAVEFSKGVASVYLMGGGERKWVKAIDNWRLSRGLSGQIDGYYAKSFDDSSWQEVDILPNKEGAKSLCSEGIYWYRFNFDLDMPGDWSIPLKFSTEINGDALIYLNGQLLGKYVKKGWQRDFYLPENWLNLNGDNSIALIVKSNDVAAEVCKASVNAFEEYAVKTNVVDFK